MDKTKWTDRLPDLLEGYTEAEPEGLWDAVQAGMKPKARRVAAGWWYAAGSLAAAAAVALTVFLWPERSTGTDSPVPGVTPSGPAVAQTDPIDTPSGPATSAVPHITESPDSSTGEQKGADIPTGVTSTPATGQKRPDLPQETVDEPAQEQKEPEMHLNDEETPSMEQKEPEPSPEKVEPMTETVPAEWLRPGAVPSTRKKGGKVQLSVTSGGLMAQAGTLTRNGFGLPETKASNGSGPVAAPRALFSTVLRNKASTTEAKHWQNFRAGLMANYAFSPRWSIETGLQYTSLQARETTNTGNSTIVADRHFNYLGIPLNVQFKPLEFGQFSLYLSAGPMYEFLVGAREKSQSVTNGVLVYEDIPHALDLNDRRWSINGGVGLQWQPFRFGAIFIQPGVSWHIPGGENAPETFYTARPVAFDLVFGARILLH